MLKRFFLIHGYPTSSYDWAKIWDTLAENYQVLAIDLLGLGFSDKPSKYVYSVQDHADQAIALIEYLKLEEVHLVGHDLGVGIIQELLDRLQNNLLVFKVQSSVFMNGSLFPEVYRPRLIQKLMASFVGHIITSFLSFRVFSKNMKNMFDQKNQPSDLDLKTMVSTIKYKSWEKESSSIKPFNFREV